MPLSISKVYDGTLAYTASAGDLSALSAALVQGDTVSGAAFSYADKNAGNGNKTVNLTQAQISDGNGGANYSVTLAGNSNSTITPRVLNASATGANRVYDTSTNASVSLQDDRIAGDVLTLSNTSASFADKNAGSNKVVTVSGIAAGGADAGNYTLASSTATTTASITPATLQVTGVSAQDRSLRYLAYCRLDRHGRGHRPGQRYRQGHRHRHRPVRSIKTPAAARQSPSPATPPATATMCWRSRPA